MSGSGQRYERDGLIVTLSREDGSATIAWQGTSDARDPAEFIDPLVQRLTRELRGLRVALDLTGTEYMNSATLYPLLDLIRELDRVNLEVVVRFSEEDWQQFLLRCVRTFAQTLQHVRLEVPTTR